MAMGAAQQGISLADLQSQLAAGKASSGGGDEGQSDFAEFLSKALAGKISMFAKFTGGALPNLSDIENASPTKALDSQGLQDKKIGGILASIEAPGGVLWRALKMVFSNNAITDFTAGVGGSIHAMMEGGHSLASMVESFAPSIPIESLGNISAQTFASAAPSKGMDLDL